MFLTWLTSAFIAAEIILYLIFVAVDRGRPRPVSNGLFYFALCLGLFTMAGTSLLAYLDTSHKVRTLGVIGARYLAVDRLMRNLRDMEIGQRGYLITGRDDYLEPYLVARQHVGPACEAVHAAYAGTDEDGRIGRLCRLVDLKVEEMAKVVALKRDGKPLEALEVIQSDSGKNLMDLARSMSEDLLRIELGDYDRALLDLAKAARARIGMAALVLAGSVLHMVIGATYGWPAQPVKPYP